MGGGGVRVYHPVRRHLGDWNVSLDSERSTNLGDHGDHELLGST